MESWCWIGILGWLLNLSVPVSLLVKGMIIETSPRVPGTLIDVE